MITLVAVVAGAVFGTILYLATEALCRWWFERD